MTRRQNYLELAIQLLIFYSLGTYFIEVEFHDTDRSHGFFLWSERIVAGLFTIEYLVRWIVSRRLFYPFDVPAVIDLLAILPFYLGFFVDLRALRLIRTLRVLRVFKLHRHNHALSNLIGAFERIRYEFGIIGFALFVIVWCGAISIHELEREAQPEVFGKMSDALWYVLVTITTVGYGDKVPITPGGRLVAGGIMLAGLAIFGTFISLIGSAFLEEIRRAGGHAGAPDTPPELATVAAMTDEHFDPHQVLKAIEVHAFHADGGEEPPAVRLLAMACRRLVATENVAQVHVVTAPGNSAS